MSTTNVAAILTGLLIAAATGVAQAAHEISVKNCSQWTARISSFNAGDPVKMFPYMEVNVPSRQSGTAKCNSDNSCDLKIQIQNSVTTAPYTQHSICLSAQESQGYTIIWTDLPSCNC